MAEYLFKVEFIYYSGTRIVPVYISDVEFHNMGYQDFVDKLTCETPYLRRLAATRVQIVDEDGQRLDLPANYRFKQ